MASPLQRAQQDGTPLIDGQAATFVFPGVEPPVLRGDFNGRDPEQAPEWQPDENDVWTIQLSRAEDAYIEYTFGTDKARVVDLFNRRRVSNGMGKYNNYFYMPKGGPTPFAAHRRGTPRGPVTRFDASSFATNFAAEVKNFDLAAFLPDAARHANGYRYTDSHRYSDCYRYANGYCDAAAYGHPNTFPDLHRDDSADSNRNLRAHGGAEVDHEAHAGRCRAVGRAGVRRHGRRPRHGRARNDLGRRLRRAPGRTGDGAGAGPLERPRPRRLLDRAGAQLGKDHGLALIPI